MYKRLLVPLDGSQFAESALEHVRSVAQGAALEKVFLVRVVVPIIADAKDYLGAQRVSDAEAKLEADAQSYLDGVAAGLRKDHIPVETLIIIDGEPAAKILEAAREHKADLIIMSTHGRSGFSLWVHGSVAHRVLAHSVIPVLMVAPHGTRSHKV